MYVSKMVRKLNFRRYLLNKHYFLLAIVMVTVGCASVKYVGELVEDEFHTHSPSFNFLSQKKIDQKVAEFEKTVSRYAKNLKYGYFREAYRWVKHRDGRRVVPLDKSIYMYRIHSYEVLSSFMSDNGREARVMAKVSFYEIDTGALVEILDEQIWWFAEVANEWFVEAFVPIETEI
mgnify:CR=1 FL=1